MQSVFIELTKYIFAFLMAFYVLSAYRGAIIHKEEKRKGIYIQQYIIIFAIHFLGYYVLYLMKGETRYIGFYFVQLIYLIIFIAFYYILYHRACAFMCCFVRKQGIWCKSYFKYWRVFCTAGRVC